ncbi:MAG TPA: PBP1A family penicillin-binding protein, partial [Rhodothermales bacterium]
MSHRPDSGESQLPLWADAILANLRTPGRRVGAIAPLSAAFALILVLGYGLVELWRIPSVDELNRQSFAQATVLYAHDGQEVSRYYEKNRTWIPLDSVARSTIDALIATEDRRFYKHWGIDVRRTLGAAVATIGGDPQGGSTITMQLVRNVYPHINDDFLLARKAKEWAVALRLERRYSKDEILEVYLNTVPFVFNTFGIQTAAMTYFGKSASELTVPESATLVGMLKGTMFYNPRRNPERALMRRNVVIQQMEEAGFLTAAEAEAYVRTPLQLDFQPVTTEDNRAPYFAEFVRRWLDEWAARKGYNPYTDGLRVYTTLDVDLQEAAEKAVREESALLQAVADVTWSRQGLAFHPWDPAAYVDRPEIEDAFAYFWDSQPEVLSRLARETPRFRRLASRLDDEQAALQHLLAEEAFVDSLKEVNARLQASFVAIDPRSGHIRAWVGGRDFRADKYDHVALAKRQPGSTFKPFVYAAALDNGYSPGDVFVDRRMTFRNAGSKSWTPRNFGGESGEAMTLRTALAHSKNTITAQLMQRVGARRVAEYAHRMGIESPLTEVPSLGLGTSEVSLLELTAAYATIVNHGVYRPPIFVTRIEDRHGKVIERFDSEERSAISGAVSYTLLDMLRGVVNGGTGTRIRTQYNVRGDLAGKTGTTQGGADGWFMLLHPDLVMGSWVGFNSPLVRFRTSYWGQGAHNALRI